LTVVTVTVITVTVMTETAVAACPIIEATPMADERELTIDELATATRVPSRTIRFYQSEGALPKPTIRGRVAYYTSAHVDRLAQITTLQDRGLQIKAIRDVLVQAEKGDFSLQEWLGAHDQLSSPWVGDRAKLFSSDEIQREIDGRRPGLLGDLVRVGLVERRGDSYLVESPALFSLALRLEGVGVPLENVRDLFRILNKHLSRLADDLTGYFLKNADALGENVDEAYGELRPVSLDAVRVVFAREMERTTRKANESGAAAVLSRRKRGKKSPS
jgi:DNA-binding transcriptional MerR regulator